MSTNLRGRSPARSGPTMTPEDEFLEAQARWEAVRGQFDRAAEEMRLRRKDPDKVLARSEEGEAYLLGRPMWAAEDGGDAKTGL